MNEVPGGQRLIAGHNCLTMSDIMYKQCELERPTEGGIAITVAWIPIRFAVKGAIVALKDGEVWRDGWKIKDASNHSLDEKFLNERSRDHLKTRQGSDI